MNKWFVRFTTYIVLIVGLNLLGLAFFIGETLQGGWTTRSKVYVAVSFFISFILLSALIYILLKKMLSPVGEVTDLIKDLSKGYYWRRIYSKDVNDALDELITHSNQLAKQLQKSTENEHRNENRLQAIIRHMGSGLLFVSHKGKIVLSNQTVLDMLQWKEAYHQSIYYHAPLPNEIIEMIKDTFTYEKEIKKHITLESGIRRIEIDLFVAPVKAEDDKLRGIVLVFHDITDLKNLEKMRQDFVANVSHELKTPLTSIKGFTETLLDGAMHSEKHLVQFLEIINKESERLDRLIQDLLDLSHIEQKKLQLQWMDVDLTKLVQETILLLEPRAEAKQINLIFSYEEEAVVRGDSDRLSQILLNLISNAIQYTPEQGKVEVTIERWANKGYQLCVMDTGVGIKESEIPRIFERFYRVDKARSRSSGGTGLGLAIVKHLVEVHRGEIKVTSEEGKGSRFSVLLHS